MDITENEKRVINQIRKMRMRWQVFFAAGLLPYIVTLLYDFRARPGLNLKVIAYLQNLDSISFILAIVLAFSILLLKRKYLSRKFIASILKQDAVKASDSGALIKELFGVLNRKFAIIWMLGIALIVEGVVYFWLTFADRNMHLYAFVGAYSLLMNYPRKLFFESVSYQIEELYVEGKNNS